MLGAAAAQRLGIDRIYPGERIWVGGQWFYVAGILNPAVLAPEIDTSVLVGYPAARAVPRLRRPPLHHLPARPDQPGRPPSTACSPPPPTRRTPSEVNVSQPSAALTAQADAKGAFNGLFLGLGAVALLVGAVGVANIMVISVLERRSEIGLRRALGATRGHIRIQFLSEAILLALVGGAVGVAAGALATAIYAHAKGWAIVIPAARLGGRTRRRAAHRRRRRPAARPPRRPHVAHPGALDPLTAPLPRVKCLRPHPGRTRLLVAGNGQARRVVGGWAPGSVEVQPGERPGMFAVTHPVEAQDRAVRVGDIHHRLVRPAILDRAVLDAPAIAPRGEIRQCVAAGHVHGGNGS